MTNDPLVIAGRSYASRLLVGSGKYRDIEQAKAVIEASGADIITVALRRAELQGEQPVSLQSVLPPALESFQNTATEQGEARSGGFGGSAPIQKKYVYLPNSSGCYSAAQAVRNLQLARNISGGSLVKLEVIADKQTLMPDAEQTIKATKMLADDGFNVMAYIPDDPAIAAAVQLAGAVAVMPLGSPIGSGQGILRPQNIRAIVKQAGVPVIVDAGIGTASDACFAMELGADGVLLNSALAYADDPIQMAFAMKQAVIAGRAAYLAGRMPVREMAIASSPLAGVICD